VAEKTISKDDLRRLVKRGADVKFQPKATEIANFDELLEVLKQIANNEQERIRADIQRNQTNLEILATLQAQLRKQGTVKAGPAPDMTPIIELLTEIREEREERERVAYNFDIKRDGRGFAQSITATPVCPTTH
jgi:hypothetical protein